MQIRHAISARLDGEDPGLDDAAVYAHLAGCADCRSFAHDAESLHRQLRLSPAPAIPDLTPGILAAIGEESRTDATAATGATGVTGADTGQALRWILLAIALAQITVAIPALVFGADAGLPVHTARHIGSFDVALGVGFLYAAWKPSRIPGLLPVVAALVVCLVGSSLLDVASGNTAALGEVQHVLDFVGLVVVWLLSRPAPRPLRLAS
jgi:predicted anti-sigma-YlaC factor YlaD